MKIEQYARAVYAYKADHVMRAVLIVSIALNLGLASFVWVLIGLLWVWR